MLSSVLRSPRAVQVPQDLVRVAYERRNRAVLTP